MKTQLRTAASVLAFSLLAGVSGAALADWPTESQFSAYHLASIHNAASSQGQAGRAGPANISGLQGVADWPTESAYSAYHLASLNNQAGASQAGRAGPGTLDGSVAVPANIEIWHSIYDSSAGF